MRACLFVQRQREAAHEGLGGGIGGESREWKERGNGGNVQDCSTLPRGHGDQRRSRESHQCVDVDRNLVALTCGIKFGDLAEAAVARVIDHHFNRPRLIGNACLNLFNTRRCCKVDNDHLGICTVCADCSGDACELVRASRHQHQVPPALGELQRHALTNP